MSAGVFYFGQAKVGGLKQQILEKMVSCELLVWVIVSLIVGVLTEQGIALEQQRLIFQGKVLKDDVELEKYGEWS